MTDITNVPNISVSIHSRLFKPGEYAPDPRLWVLRQFQSTPDYLNRENATALVLDKGKICFNPLPII